jgi:ATP-binding cassette subfamily B protein
MIALLAVLSVGSNALTLWLPKVISHAIDAFAQRTLVLDDVAWRFGLISTAIFVLTYLLSIVQTYVSERVAKDLRNQLAAKISRQSNAYVQQVGAARLLTNLTSDIDSVKLFVAQAVVSLISSLFLIIGASALLIMTNWKLASITLLVVPIIGVTFFLTLRKVRALFFQSREVIDRLNKSINESILGAALVRVLNTQKREFQKFSVANEQSRSIGLQIVQLFAGLIPLITFFASASILTVLALGGRFLILGSMSLGDFAAFNTYIGILIFPILIIGFVSNIIAQASASYGRIAEVLESVERKEEGTLTNELRGDIEVKDLTITYGEKSALKDVSFKVAAGSRTAIIGPTAAGKTQLLYALTGLLEPDSGTILFDGQNIHDYDKATLHRQVGFVFQDSIVFNLTLRENIAFSSSATDESLEKAIATAELGDLIESLPNKLDTVVTERGTSLSGGQKQRLMLARALALNPKILLLDDFTARVDTATEAKIVQNLRKNYPGMTLISVTQKVASVTEYDEIIVLMEGELLASGRHEALLDSSPEYVQIFNSQQSTNELHA